VLVPRLDVDALTSALNELLSAPERLRLMGQAARARAERLLTWERSTERLERVYLDLLARESVVDPAPAQ
jgi:glycosyltransferase involved in cell wall biosynthesis